MSLSTFIFMLAVAGAAATPETAPMSPSSSVNAVEQVRLEVDHRALLAQQMVDAAEDSAFFIRKDGAKVLRERHGVEVVDDANAPTIIVELAWKDYESSVYLIEISTRRPNDSPRVVESFEATCINNTALTKVVLAKLPAALEQLARPKEEDSSAPVVEDAATKPAEAPAEAEENPAMDDGRRVPLGPMGQAGIGLLAAGAVGVITGGIVLAQKRQLDENDPTALDWEGRDFRAPGVGVMIAGGVVAVTGAVLLVVDRVQAQRVRSTPRRGAWLIPSPTGLSVAGRF